MFLKKVPSGLFKEVNVMIRKGSFVIVEIMEQKSPLICMDRGLKIVNSELTLLIYLKSINYYLITLYLSFVRYFCAKQFDIKNVTLADQNITRLLKPEQKINIPLLIFDNGVRFYGFFIPYEHIIQFGHIDNKISIKLFVNIEPKEKELILTLAKKISNLIFDVTNINVASQLIKSIKINMYYHIKFNKPNIKILKQS